MAGKSKLTGSLCGSDGGYSTGSKPRLLSKNGDESNGGYGGSTCSGGGKTTSSPDKDSGAAQKVRASVGGSLINVKTTNRTSVTKFGTQISQQRKSVSS